MAIPKFFHQADNFRKEETIILSEDEARHASQSRRLQVSDEVLLLNGDGLIATGYFTELNRKKAVVLIKQVKEVKRSEKRIIIASALPKGDRQKVMIDMLTQLGVNDFIPLETEFSIVKANDKSLEKWRRLVIEACKQSGNPFLMNIHSPLSLSELMTNEVWHQSRVFFADQQASKKQLTNLTEKNACLAIIGPEGGFSDIELERFTSEGTGKMQLSTHILRTEAAAVAAAAALINA